MLTALSIQLTLFRKAQKIQLEIELSKKHEKALEAANLKLEAEVKARTHQLAEINMLHRSILNSDASVLRNSGRVEVVNVLRT